MSNTDKKLIPQSPINSSLTGMLEGIKEIHRRGKVFLEVEASVFERILTAAISGENFEAKNKCTAHHLEYFLQTVKINQTNYEGIETPLVQEKMIAYIKSKLPEVSDWEFVPKVGNPLAIILTADITFPGAIEAVRTLVVSIKGTTNIHETIQDIRSLEIVSFHNSKGKMVGFSESGFIDHYDEIIGKETFNNRLRCLLCMGKSSSTYLNIADIVEKSKKFPGGLLIIGHSLGAAVANLMALDIATSYPGTPMHVVTFGCPRTFFSETAKFVDAMNIKIDRVVNRADPICHLPLDPHGLLYRHVGTTFALNSSDKTWYRCSNGQYAGDGSDVLLGCDIECDTHCLSTYGGYIETISAALA